MAKRTAEEWFNLYGESHQNPVNKFIHFICVPLIMFSLLGLMWAVPMPESLRNYPYFNLALLFVAFALVFYLRMSVIIAVGMLFVAVGMCLALANMAAMFDVANFAWIHFGIFFLAWVGQFIGHKIEGKKPSFFQDLQFLLVGPAWILAYIYIYLRIRY